MKRVNGRPVSRREFLAAAAAVSGGVAASSLVACSPSSSESSGDAVETEKDGVAAGSAGSGDSDWLGSAPLVDESSLAETIDVEVLVVGNGPAGTACAMRAAENGSNVLLIEKDAAGSGWRSSAMAAVDSRYQKEAGVTIDKEAIVNDIAHYALGQCDMQLIRNWADNSGEVIDWLGTIIENAGFQYHLEYNMPSEDTRYAMWPVGHGTVDASGAQASETEICEALVNYLMEQGGAFRANTGMTSLIVEEGRVVGAYATNENEEVIRINASKGVVLAAGGYLLNTEMFRARQGDLEKVCAGLLVPFPRVGDGVKAGIWAGGRLDEFPTSMLFDRGAVLPDKDTGDIFAMNDFFHFDFGSQPFLKVAKTGYRIGNESAPYDFIAHAAGSQPGHAWYTIWDSSWKEDVERFHTIGCSTLVPREGACQTAPGLDSVEESMAQGVEGGYIIKADTLEELAEGLLISNVDAFVAEVENYNAMYAAGEDTQYGKDAFRLSGVDEPPFYGMKQGAEPLCTLDGLVVDRNNQVLDENNEPIGGLYAVGNDSGRFYAHTYPNFAAGLNAGRCVTGGWMVANTLAKL